MLKPNPLTATLLAFTLGLASAPIYPVQARVQSEVRTQPSTLNPQPPSFLRRHNTNKTQNSKLKTQNSQSYWLLKSQIAASWGGLWDRLRRRKGEGGSRGYGDPEFPCMIAPVRLRNRNPRAPKDPPRKFVVWDNRPLFLWKAPSRITPETPADEKLTITTLEVRHARRNTLMWSETLPEPEPGELRWRVYAGKPLERGVTYNWGAPFPQRLSNVNQELPLRIHFSVMEQEDYDQVARQLAAMERQATAEGKSATEKLEQRVDFFLKKQLWADAVREIYLGSAGGKTKGIAPLRQLIEAENFCPPRSTHNTARENPGFFFSAMWLRSR